MPADREPIAWLRSTPPDPSVDEPAVGDEVRADEAASLTAREAARRRMALDGADAQALEGALAMTERERDEALLWGGGLRKDLDAAHEQLARLRAENERLRAVVEAARIAAQQLDEVLGRGALASVMDALDALDREEVSR